MIGKLYTVAFDAPDHLALARFYAALLDGEVTSDEPDWANVDTADGWHLGFQLAPDHVPPTWPSQQLPQQLHLDFQVPDPAEAARRAESLGAATVGGDGELEHGPKLIIMTDPAGHPFCLCANEQAEPIRVFGACIDCPDPAALAGFYARLLGLEVRYQGDDGAWLGGDGPLASLTFQRVDGYQPPEWPDPARPQQVHLDVLVDDVDAAEPQLLEIGGRSLPGSGDGWRVYADPAGHPFCLVFDAEESAKEA
jgi:predicted enzyme related to lactoylglutathione lyase/catechol 2,3-dioxygenase-like lactoylglutathione lyase family enzyme